MNAAQSKAKQTVSDEALPVTSSDLEAWDSYVRQHKEGSFFHLSAWGRVAEAAYGFEPIYLTVERNNRLAGVLPLVDVKSPFFGRSLVSTAYSVGGGPLADDQAALEALLDEARKLGKQRGVKFIECRSDFDGGEGWIKKSDLYANFQLPLFNDEEAQLKAVPRKRRADVRKAIREEADGNLSIRFDGSIEEFYALYALSLQRHGTPIFPKRFLYGLLSAFQKETEIAIVEAKGAPVAALLTFYYGEWAMPYYVGATEDARRLHAFDYLYWSAMRRAARRGCGVYDFGRSKIDTGPFSYKRNWGASPRPLTYNTLLINATEAPSRNPSDPKYKTFVKLWPYLPLPATKALGPLLAPNFP